MQSVFDYHLDEWFTIEAQNVRDLLGDYERNNQEQLTEADDYAMYTLTNGRRQAFRRGDKIDQWSDSYKTVYEVCGDSCSYIMSVLTPNAFRDTERTLFFIACQQRLAQINLAFPIHVVHALKDVFIVISERPRKTLIEEVHEFLRTKPTEVEARAFAKRLAPRIASVIQLMFEQGYEFSQLAYDASGRLRVWQYDHIQRLDKQGDANDLNLLLGTFIVVHFELFRLLPDEPSILSVKLAMQDELDQERIRIMRELQLTTPPRVTSDPLEHLTDRAVTTSGIEDVMSVHACARDDPQCRLSDIIGDNRDPETALMARSAASYLFRGTGCKHYKQGDKLGEHSGHRALYFSCCGSDCDHITKVVSFDGSECTANLFVNEVKMQHLVYEAGLGPAVNMAYLSPIGGVLVMDKLDRTLDDVIRELIDSNASAVEAVPWASFASSAAGRSVIDAVQKRARELTHQVADVLYRLHLHNLWHGDTHIGNFMFTRSGELKVIDFGQTVYVTRNQILNMTQHAYSSQTQYEYEYYQYHTSLDRLADSYRTEHAESEIYSGLAHVFSEAAFDTWRVRVNQEFRELVAL